jgi:signal transduction histidine kinase/ActR/RegA family two-component response regulator
MSAYSESILILAATARDAALAVRALEQGNIKSLTCNNGSELAAILQQGVGAILLSEEACREEIVAALDAFWDSQPTWSDLPIVFLQPPNTSFESGGAARLRARGNLSLLERPLRQITLISAVETALRARRRQYQVRDLIEEKETDVRGRDEFLAMLGHELRNPLAAIRYAIGLINEIDEGEETRAPREVIARQTTHLARLVDDLLDVARVTRGKISLHKKPIDLNELAKKSLESLEVARKDSNHQIDFVPSPLRLMIEGDAIRIEQILSNLLFNAVKYTPTGGKIQLQLQSETNNALIIIEDNGIGMSAELLSRIFDLFSQAQHSIDRSRGGLGIGLTLVRGLVELHGGRITASSKGVGQGSRFEVRFPLINQANVTPETELPALPKGKRRVLLIEDNDDSRHILRLLLEHSGHVVESAADGLEGVEKALEIRPDIALVDIGLPIIDGYEVATRVRAAFGDSIFLVALTGYNQPEDRRRAHEAGFNEHLAKPIAAAKLRELMERAPSYIKMESLRAVSQTA